MSLGNLPSFQAIAEHTHRHLKLMASLVGLSARCREEGDDARAAEIDIIVKEAQGK